MLEHTTSYLELLTKGLGVMTAYDGAHSMNPTVFESSPFATEDSEGL